MPCQSRPYNSCALLQIYDGHASAKSDCCRGWGWDRARGNGFWLLRAMIIIHQYIYSRWKDAKNSGKIYETALERRNNAPPPSSHRQYRDIYMPAGPSTHFQLGSFNDDDIILYTTISHLLFFYSELVRYVKLGNYCFQITTQIVLLIILF